MGVVGALGISLNRGGGGWFGRVVGLEGEWDWLRCEVMEIFCGVGFGGLGRGFVGFESDRCQ